MDYKKITPEINNFINDNLKALEQLFPNVVKDGEVDFEALKEELGHFKEVEQEKYEFTWTGKQEAKKIAQTDVVNRTLKFIPEDSKDVDTTENLYIEGDNLEVLKLIRQNYYGAIKMIYIDPPYNTDNDFIYNDKFKISESESNLAEGYINNEGEKLQKVSKTSNRYHANWLNMMYPRLKVAKDLLTEDGVIFISIDDNEFSQLKLLCDEIFGENSFVTVIHVEMSTTQGMKVKSAKNGNIVKNAEYILVYSKDGHKNIAKKVLYDFRPEYDNHYLKILGENNEVLNVKDVFLNQYPTETINNIVESYSTNPVFRKFIEENVTKIFRYDKVTGFDVNKFEENVVTFVERGQRKYALQRKGNNIEQLMFLSDSFGECNDFKKSKGLRKIRGDWWSGFYLDMGNVSKEGNVVFKNGKKPKRLIKQLLQMTTDKDSIILDFFSGSGTTGHAVFELNNEDSGNRKFIMVQLPEKTDEKNEVHKARYKNICEIGRDRIHRAGEKIKEECLENNKPIPDIGFKVFRTSDTNIKWNLEKSTLNLFDDDIDNIDFTEGFNDIDVVYEIMLHQKDVPLYETIETLTNIGNRTYLYASSYLICLEKEITNEMIEKLATLEPLPLKFVFRDSAFKDNLNLKDETFRRLNLLIEKNSDNKTTTYTVEFI